MEGKRRREIKEAQVGEWHSSVVRASAGGMATYNCNAKVICLIEGLLTMAENKLNEWMDLKKLTTF